MTEQDTIVALSTPPGTGAIGLVRISGPDALLLLRSVAAKMDRDPAPRLATLVEFRDSEGVIDEGLATVFRAPASYTGEDVVELGVHGSPYVQQRLIEALLQAGGRLALPGEFTQRAFLNRKLDLSQAEAVADLIASQSAAQHRLALQQLRGGFGRRIEALRQQLIDLCALVELELDFSEEDVEFADRGQLRTLMDEVNAVCTELIASFRFGNAVRQGIPVAIVGAPNAGKSTLLNALLQDDRALVSDIPGTTRDTVEEAITLEGVLFRFIDTAGLRETGDTVEQMGIARSYRKAGEASIVVLLGDAGTLSEGGLLTEARLLTERLAKDRPEGLPAPLVVPVLNKCDIPGASQAKQVIGISARDGTGLDRLKEEFLKHVNALQSGEGGVVVTNARHVEALRRTVEALTDARAALDGGVSDELLAIDLRRAQHHLGEITGRITTDDLLGSIFSRFCIGK